MFTGWNWNDLFSNVQHGVTTLGIGIAGVWAWYNFIRGRTYRPRCELTVSGTVFGAPTRRYFVPRVRLSNTGRSRLLLEQKGSGFRICISIEQAEQPMIPVTWSAPSCTYEMFLQHQWIEPGETVVDEEQVIPLPSEYIAIKIEVRLCAQVRRWPKRNIEINAAAVVPGGTGEEVCNGDKEG